jgi:hypothetical protein
MAEINLETIIKGAELLGGAAAEKMKALKKELGETGLVALNFKEILTKIGFESAESFEKAVTSVKYFADSMEDAFNNLNFFGDISKTVSDNISSQFRDMASTGLTEYAKQLDININNTEELAAMTVVALSPLIGIIPPTITGLGDIGSAGITAGQKLSKSFEPFADALGGLGGKISQELSAADKAYQLEQHIIEAASAQGKLHSLLDDSGTKFSNLNELFNEYTMMSYRSAQATGQTKASMDGLLDSLKTIPGAWTESIQVGDTVMSQAVSVSKMASGFAKSQEEVVSKVNDLYANMGSSGIKAYNSLANIYDLAEDSTKLRQAFVSTVMDISKSFNMLGDNTEAATAVVNAFDKTFTNMELSPAAIQNVVSTLAEGTKKFDMARGAFISGMTGGPGGLAGGIQIEYALQTGKLDEVMAKMLRSIESQFGGGVVTLEQAAKSPELSGEYYKQLQLVSQIAGVGEREASKILDAMKAGVIGDLEKGAKTQNTESLEKAIDRGTDRQEVLVKNPLLRIYQILETSATTHNKMALLAVDSTFAAISTDLSLKTLTAKESIETAKERARESGTTSVFRNDSSRSDLERQSVSTALGEDMNFLGGMFEKAKKIAEKEGAGLLKSTEATTPAPELESIKTSTTSISTIPTITTPGPVPEIPKSPNIFEAPSGVAERRLELATATTVQPVSTSPELVTQIPTQPQIVTPEIKTTKIPLTVPSVSATPTTFPTSSSVTSTVPTTPLAEATTPSISMVTGSFAANSTSMPGLPTPSIETQKEPVPVASFDYSVFPSMLNMLSSGVDQLSKLNELMLSAASPTKQEAINSSLALTPIGKLTSEKTTITEALATVKEATTKETTTTKIEKLSLEIEPLTIKLQWPEPFDQVVQSIATDVIANQSRTQSQSGVS